MKSSHVTSTLSNSDSSFVCERYENISSNSPLGHCAKINPTKYHNSQSLKSIVESFSLIGITENSFTAQKAYKHININIYLRRILFLLCRSDVWFIDPLEDTLHEASEITFSHILRQKKYRERKVGKTAIKVVDFLGALHRQVSLLLSFKYIFFCCVEKVFSPFFLRFFCFSLFPTHTIDPKL